MTNDDGDFYSIERKALGEVELALRGQTPPAEDSDFAWGETAATVARLRDCAKGQHTIIEGWCFVCLHMEELIYPTKTHPEGPSEPIVCPSCRTEAEAHFLKNNEIFQKIKDPSSKCPTYVCWEKESEETESYHSLRCPCGFQIQGLDKSFLKLYENLLEKV